MKIVFSILVIVTILVGSKCDKHIHIPDKAFQYEDVLYTEVSRLLPDHKIPYYFSALIEHESCVHLCGTGYWARRCWSPKSQLKTKREEGAGLPQLTRAYTRSGRLRFDTIRNLRKRYGSELKELTWDNVYDRPDLQIRAMLLLWNSNFTYFSKRIDYYNRIWFSDSAYNGGLKYLIRERKKCKLTKNCDPNLWFDNVEKMNSRGNRVLYGKRTAHMINRHHVKDVRYRLNKYMYRYVIYKREKYLGISD